MTNQSATIPTLDKGLVAFHASWHDVEWNNWITQAEQSLDVMVFYWDKWTREHFDALAGFLNKPGTKLRFFFTDETDPGLLKQIQRLFPDYNSENIKQKILNTTKPLEDYIKDQGISPEKLEIIRIPHVHSYPFQIIDGRYVVISIFEMYRDKHAHAPAFIVDLWESPELAKFFQKELHCLLHVNENLTKS